MSIFLKFFKTYFFVVLLVFSFCFSQEAEESESKGKVDYLYDTSLQLENDRGTDIALFLNINNITITQGMFTLTTELWITFDSISGKKDISINQMIARVNIIPDFFDFEIYHGRTPEWYGTYYKTFAYLAGPIFNDSYIPMNGFMATIVATKDILVFIGANLSKENKLINLAEHYIIVDGTTEISSGLTVGYMAQWFIIDDGEKSGHFDFTTGTALHSPVLGLKLGYAPLGIDFFATFESNDALNNFTDAASSAIGLSWSDTAEIPFFDKINMELRVPFNEENPVKGKDPVTGADVDPLLGVYVDLHLSYGAFYSKFYIQNDLGGDENKISYGSVGGVSIPFSTTF